MDTLQIDSLTAIVRRVLNVQDITVGEARQGFLVRYRGQLYGDSAEAYDQLAEALRPLGVTPLFRKDQELHAVILVEGTLNPKTPKPWLNVILFALTLFSVALAGASFEYSGPPTASFMQMMAELLRNITSGLPFALSLLGILLAHEFGHYLVGRRHKTMVTLPYFIPIPFLFSLFGTMGAVIQLKEPPKNRRTLLDIGLAGPISGLIVAIPIVLYGLSISKVQPIVGGQNFMLEGNSILYLAAKYLVFGRLLPEPVSYGGLSPILFWLRFFFTGGPIPVGGLDVTIHPIAWAGWAGMMVTAFNLIPAGQLDGGHVLYSLLGRKMQSFLPFILVGLVLLGWFWNGWWLLAFLIFMLGRYHAEPLDQITTLDTPRKWLAALGILIFILTFIPVPLVFGS